MTVFTLIQVYPAIVEASDVDCSIRVTNPEDLVSELDAYILKYGPQHEIYTIPITLSELVKTAIKIGYFELQDHNWGLVDVLIDGKSIVTAQQRGLI